MKVKKLNAFGEYLVKIIKEFIGKIKINFQTGLITLLGVQDF